MDTRWRIVLLTLALLPFASFASPQLKSSDYERTEVKIRMRDGVDLFTVYFRPKKQTGPLPIILTRTPYDAGGQEIGGAYLSTFVTGGYIIAFQDIRGHFQSEGRFVMSRPMRDPKVKGATDEATDAWDTVDWLVKNVPQNNGKVGILGISYDGWTALIAGIDPHPALKAVSPQASPVDMWSNDDFHRNGAFRLSYGFEYAYAMESGRGWTPYPFHHADMYDWYLKLGPLSNVEKWYFRGKIPSWTGFVDHPNHDDYWTSRNAISWMTKAKVPMLIVAGFWDQEDPVGPSTAYRALSKNDPRKLVRLVVGPWNHGGWAGPGALLDAIEFGSSTGATFRNEMQGPFFDHYLKGVEPLKVGQCTMFQSGSNEWKTYDQWPPKSSKAPTRLYLRNNEGLSFDRPTDNKGFDSYISDPAHPVPYRPRPIEATYGPGSRWFNWHVQDQRFVDHRPDVRSWKTEPLMNEIELTGDVVAHLYASTSGTDCDWIVKLIDVYPDEVIGKPKMGGYQLMTNSEVVRARFRKSESRPSAVPANKPLLYDIDLHWTNHTFLKGHRIMVQVQSSWFPVIDRNPQRFVENIFLAKASDFRTATQKVYRTTTMPSCIEVRTAGAR